ncbi:MAG: Maf family protein [Cytophagales bacterium]|nr:Maf family protein [Cytophagales bacterium]MDW8383880.1 Maf family protein [Flammeovirgaceae bacterium]
MFEIIRDFHLILASASPRRKEILQQAGFSFSIRKKNIEESYSPSLHPLEVPTFLAKKKAESYAHELSPNEILITADTVVILENQILGKPQNKQEAFQMLTRLSGKKHAVVTGICLSSYLHQHTFDQITYVYFKPLSQAQIEYYIEHYSPFDKAGAYGIQEWIGLIGVSRIEGCFYNVVGFPIQKFCDELQNFVKNF